MVVDVEAVGHLFIVGISMRKKSREDDVSDAFVALDDGFDGERFRGNMLVVVERVERASKHERKRSGAMTKGNAIIYCQLNGGNVDFPGRGVALTEFEEELLCELDVAFCGAVGLRVVGGDEAMLETHVVGEVRDDGVDEFGAVVGLQDLWDAKVREDGVERASDGESSFVRKWAKKGEAGANIYENECEVEAR